MKNLDRGRDSVCIFREIFTSNLIPVSTSSDNITMKSIHSYIIYNIYHIKFEFNSNENYYSFHSIRHR